MSWDDLNIKEKSDLMRLYISNGIMDLDSIKEHYNSFATGGALPDHDPNNPYHYHDAEGNKVVISPEDWEANVGKPYFREIEDAVKAEQAAHPGPEYEINPAFVRDLNSSVAAARGQNGMINYVGYKNQLPQGYTINENGIIFDDKGQAYVQESYPQSTRFTYNADSPLQFKFNQGKPIERNVNFYPVNMDMKVKPPLPVDRVMDVDAERENTIKTIQDNLVYRSSLENILPGFEGGMMVGNTPLYYDFSSKNNHKEFIKKYLENITGTPVTFIKYNDDYDNIVELNKEQLDAITKNSKLYYDKLDREQIGRIKKYLSKISPNDFRTKEDYDEDVDVNNKYIQSLSDYINSSDFYYDRQDIRPKPYKLSRKEAEKKAVIKIDPLKKTKTFEEGGPVNNKSDWAKAHEVELALQQLGWDNPNNKLHSDYAAKDDKGYYAGYNLKPVTITAKHPLWNLPDYQGNENNPNINAYKDELWENRKEREETGKEYLKNIGRVGLTIGTLPMLGYGAIAAPLTTGLSLAGGEGLNYGINKLTPYNSWGNMLAEGVFNTDNELAQTALEFTNLGFLLGPKAAPFVNNQYRGLRVANELRRGIRNTELPPRVAKNTAHTRTKLGDVEVDDPNLMYHVDNGDYTGFSGNGAYVKDGMLFPSQHFNGQKPYTWWNLGRPYRNNQTRLLTTTKDNPSLLRVRDQDYPIGQWTGNPKDRTFVTNQEYVSSEPIRIGNGYKLDHNYGYRRIQEPIPTLEQAYQEAMIEKYPLVLSHNISNDYLKSTLLGRHKSLLNPSTSLGRAKYNSEIDNHTSLIFGKDMLNNPHTPYLGDGNTPMVYEFFDDGELISRYSTRKINQRMHSKSGIPLSKLGAGEQISLDDAIRIARENVAKGDNFNTYNELKFDGLIPVKKAGYGFTDSEEIADMLHRRGIITNFDFYTSNPNAYSNYEDFLKNVVFKNPDYKFRKGGKLNS